jgi:hypothetical protein
MDSYADSQASDTILVDSLEADTLQGLAQQASEFDTQLIDPALTSSNTPSRVTSQTPDILPITAIQAKRAMLNWTDEMHRALLEGMLEQCRAGKRADSGFKKEIWTAILPAIQVAYSGPIQITQLQVKSRAEWYKAMWKEWCSLEENSGFGWDEPTQLFTAEESVWRNYLQVSYTLTIIVPL